MINSLDLLDLKVALVSDNVIVCGNITIDTTIDASTPTGATLPLFTVSNAAGVDVKVYPFIQPVDARAVIADRSTWLVHNYLSSVFCCRLQYLRYDR